MYLPEDLMLQVLVRLPAKSLSRFRSVCKTWLAIIDSPSFMSQYLMLTYGVSKNDRNLHLICQEEVFGPTSMASLLSDEQIIDLKDSPSMIDVYEEIDTMFYPKISGPINGIYCIKTDRNHSLRCTIMFWNPGNGQFHVLRPIPPPVMPAILEDMYNERGCDPLDGFYGGFGFDPVSQDYKFISISEYGDKYWDQCHFACFHVYSLASNSWQGLDPFQIAYPSLITIDDDGLARFELVMGRELAFPFNGSCFWLINSNPEVDVYLISFNMESHVFSVTSISRKLLSRYPAELTSVDGCLAATCPASDDKPTSVFDVCVMKEYGVEESWIKAYTMILNSPGNFLGIVVDEFFVQETDGWVVSYRLGAHQEDFNEYCYVPFQRLAILPFKGSFIPIHHNMNND